METSLETAGAAGLHPDTHIGRVALTVSDLGRSLDFYQNVLGFKLLEQGQGIARLGADGTALLVLHEIPGAPPKPRRATGLYHFAILVPSRHDLARAIYRLAETQYPITGGSDHAVSEALYLDDPDGNGIEIYRDRPRDTWKWDDKTVRMALDPLDYDGILGELGEARPAWTGLAPETVIGHVHLHIGDIAQAAGFYHGVLGFDIMAEMSGALFVSAGGYHHHLGLNIWAGRGVPPSPPTHAGLRYYSIMLPNDEELARAAARLQAAAVSFERQDGAIALKDPWQNGILLTSNG